MSSPWPRHQHELSQAAPDSPQRGPRHLSTHLQLPRGALQKEVPVLTTQQQMHYSTYRAAGARTRTRGVKEEKRAYAKLRGRGAIFP